MKVDALPAAGQWVQIKKSLRFGGRGRARHADWDCCDAVSDLATNPVHPPVLYLVLHNLERQKLQYAMQEHLRRAEGQDIEIIDKHLGCSGGQAPRCVPSKRLLGSGVTAR